MVQDFVGHVLVPAHSVPIVTPQALLKDSYTSRGQRYHLWLRTTTLEAKPSFVYLPPLDPSWARSHRSSPAECCQPLSTGGAIQATHFAFTLVTFSLLNCLARIILPLIIPHLTSFSATAPLSHFSKAAAADGRPAPLETCHRPAWP